MFLTQRRTITTVPRVFGSLDNSATRPAFGRSFTAGGALALAVLGCGCVAPPTQLHLIDYRAPGELRRFSPVFEEAWFDIDPRGNLDLILRHTADPEPGRTPVSQIVHVATVWPSIPGQTVANETQINATATYALLGAGADSTYEGGGSVIFYEDPWTGRLSGELNRMILLPGRAVSPGEPVFGRVELSGPFQAERDPRRTVQMKNDLRRRFGPRLPKPD